MTVEELKIKYENSLQKISKKRKTLENHEKRAETILANILKNGWNPNDKYAMKGTEQYYDSYWMVCDYQHKLEDIKRTKEAIAEAERISDNWKEKLDEEEGRVRKYKKEIPEALKDYQEYLIREWDAYDENEVKDLRRIYKELGYNAFVKERGYRKYVWMKDYDKDTIHKENTRDAEHIILNLYNRVKDVTGEIVSWEGLVLAPGNQGTVINGVVIGKDGKASVESILAGGYNIQKLHVRTLVKKI